MHLLELTLFLPQVQLILSEPFQHPPRDPSVLGSVLRVDEDVIDVYADDSFHDEVLEDIVHHCLERSWAVGKTKEHYQWFEQSSVRPKCCLPLISILNSDVIVAPPNIQLCEVFCPSELVD